MTLAAGTALAAAMAVSEAVAALPGIPEAAPRPAAEVRVQNRYTTKAHLAHVFAGGSYLSRRDFYVSPGVRAGITYHFIESLGVELQLSRFFSVLGREAVEVKERTGYIPDSHAPEWLVLAGGRYSLGYGKLLVGGAGRALHFEPQVFLHGGLHAYDGDVGPSSDAGIGFLVHLSPRFFARIDVAVTVDVESRSRGGTVVVGAMPSLVFGGVP